jgi:hypothetical protein
MLRLVCFGLAVLIASGCGGGSAQTVTVTGPPQTPTAAPSPADQLRTYLTAMRKAEHQWNQAQQAWRKADKVHYYNNTAPWPAIGRKLVRVRRMFDRSAVYLAGITPPPGLSKAHRAWLSSINLASAEADNYVTGFRGKNVSIIYRLDNSASREHEMGTLRTTWRLAVLALAKQLAVPVPKPLRTVGTGY